MNKLYKLVLGLATAPMVVLLLTLFTWLGFRPVGLETATLALIIVCGLLSLAGFYLLYRLYHQASLKQSQRYLQKALILFVILLINIPLLGLTYYTTQYVKKTHTIIIQNQSSKTIKRMFISNGGDMYFIKPVEPHKTHTRAIIFRSDGPATYTLSLGNKTLSGTIFRQVDTSKGGTAKLTITRREKALIEEQTP